MHLNDSYQHSNHSKLDQYGQYGRVLGHIVRSHDMIGYLGVPCSNCDYHKDPHDNHRLQIHNNVGHEVHCGSSTKPSMGSPGHTRKSDKEASPIGNHGNFACRCHVLISRFQAEPEPDTAPILTCESQTERRLQLLFASGISNSNNFAKVPIRPAPDICGNLLAQPDHKRAVLLDATSKAVNATDTRFNAKHASPKQGPNICSICQTTLDDNCIQAWRQACIRTDEALMALPAVWRVFATKYQMQAVGSAGMHEL